MTSRESQAPAENFFANCRERSTLMLPSLCPWIALLNLDNVPGKLYRLLSS